MADLSWILKRNAAQRPPVTSDAPTFVAHTCTNKGRMGMLVPGCPRCEQLADPRTPRRSLGWVKTLREASQAGVTVEPRRNVQAQAPGRTVAAPARTADKSTGVDTVTAAILDTLRRIDARLSALEAAAPVTTAPAQAPDRGAAAVQAEKDAAHAAQADADAAEAAVTREALDRDAHATLTILTLAASNKTPETKRTHVMVAVLRDGRAFTSAPLRYSDALNLATNLMNEGITKQATVRSLAG